MMSMQMIIMMTSSSSTSSTISITIIIGTGGTIRQQHQHVLVDHRHADHRHNSSRVKNPRRILKDDEAHATLFHVRFMSDGALRNACEPFPESIGMRVNSTR